MRRSLLCCVFCAVRRREVARSCSLFCVAGARGVATLSAPRGTTPRARTRAHAVHLLQARVSTCSVLRGRVSTLSFSEYLTTRARVHSSSPLLVPMIATQQGAMQCRQARLPSLGASAARRSGRARRRLLSASASTEDKGNTGAHSATHLAYMSALAFLAAHDASPVPPAGLEPTSRALSNSWRS